MLQTDLYSFSYKKGSVVPFCKCCGARNFYKAGKSDKGVQRYKCKKCGSRFVWTSDLPKRHFFSNVISFAVELYSRAGISLRNIARTLNKYFDIKISHQGIKNWVMAAKKLQLIDDECIPTKTWHIDETYVKIKGKGHWLWVVRSKESGDVISWHISQKRLLKEARTVIRKAMEKTKGARPSKIITDGLYQYDAAIKKEIGWNWRKQKKCHIKDSGIGQNWFIERLNREIKRRIKWFSTFQSLEGANAFFGLWFYHHNSLKLT